MFTRKGPSSYDEADSFEHVRYFSTFFISDHPRTGFHVTMLN